LPALFAPDAGNVDVVAAMKTDAGDRHPANDTATASLALGRFSDRALSFVTPPPDSAVVGGEVIIEFTVKNLGPTPEAHVVVTGPTLVGTLQLASEDARCSTQSGAFVCDFGALDPGAQTSASLYVSSTAEFYLDASLSVSGDNTDMTTENDRLLLRFPFAPDDGSIGSLNGANRPNGCRCGAAASENELLAFAALFALRQFLRSRRRNSSAWHV
jgi:hypothetical protein